MMHLLLLAVSTAIFIYLNSKIWKKTRQIAFPIGFAMIYYWTLMGSWFIIFDHYTDNYGKNFGLSYYGISESLFPLHVDNNYLAALGLYALFIITIQMTVLFLAKKRSDDSLNVLDREIKINHSLLIFLCLASAFISFALIWKSVLTAAKFNYSVYTVVNGQPPRFITIHQLLTELAVNALCVGFIFYLNSSQKNSAGKLKKSTLFLYIASIILVGFYLMFIGSRRIILFEGILGLLLYVNTLTSKFNWKPLALFLLITVMPLFFSFWFRTYSPSFLTKYFDVSQLEFIPKKEVVYTNPSFKNMSSSFLFSNEMFFPHYSMYGALHYQIPCTNGSSLVSFAASMIPRALMENRPETIYDYYIKHVPAKEGQGYTIHHATGWYLNFGIIGVLIGAFIVGFFWVWLYNKYKGVSDMKNNFMKLFFILGISTFTAQMPSLLRGGPEGYKAMIFEALLIPALVLFIAMKRKPSES